MRRGAERLQSLACDVLIDRYPSSYLAPVEDFPSSPWPSPTYGRRRDGQDDLEHWCRSAEFLGEPDEKAFGPADVAEPIRVLVLDHFAADELRAVFAEPGERLVDVVHGEHDAQVAEGVHRGVPMIGDHRRREKARELEPAVAVRCAHHGGLDALVAQSSDAPCPLSFDHGSPFELEAELAKELDRLGEVVDEDADIVHSFECHCVQSRLHPPLAYVVPARPALTSDF